MTAPLLAMLLVAAARATAADASAAVELPAFPVCEASAAVRVEQPHGSVGALVGDNEVSDAVFAYEVGADGTLAPRAEGWRQALPHPVADIEALARRGGDVVVVGSHGRKKKCGREPARQQLLVVRQAAGGALTLVERVAEDDGERFAARLRACATELIGLPPGDDGVDARLLRDEACAAIVAAEEAAPTAKTDDAAGQAACARTFNVEGAFVRREGKDDRVWLGLRAPLTKGRALLLRVASLKASTDGVRFDGVATLDLGGRGVRELAAVDGWLVGLAGPMEDGGEAVLWRAPASALRNGARIADVEELASGLPGASEGLLPDPSHARALILVDGDRGDAADACAVPSMQRLVDLAPAGTWGAAALAPGSAAARVGARAVGSTLALNFDDAAVELASGADLRAERWIHVTAPVRIPDDVYAVGFVQTLRATVSKSGGARVLLVADLGGTLQTWEAGYGDHGSGLRDDPTAPPGVEDDTMVVELVRESIGSLQRLRRVDAGSTWFEQPTWDGRLLLVAERRSEADHAALAIDSVDVVVQTEPPIRNDGGGSAPH